MKAHSLKSETKTLVTRGVGMVIIAILAYHALDTGIHGLRYFVNYPTGASRPAGLLLPHIGAGFIALILGPWQFWKKFRKRYLRVHRWIGRIYLTTVAISSSLGLYMAITNTNLVFSTGVTGLALAWMVTGIFAYLTIRQGFVQEHREWMIRNYVVTFAFVTYRLGYNYIPWAEQGDSAIMAWLCWVPQLFVTELWIQLSHSKLFNKKTKSSVRKVSTQSSLTSAN